MGRPSKLTDHQKAEVGRRLANGESRRALAKEFRVTEGCIRANVITHPEVIKDIATRLATAEADLIAQPINAQVSIRTLADQLRIASSHLAEAACNGAKTASILSGLATKKAEAMTAYDEFEVRGIAALAATGTEASKIATTLINGKNSQPVLQDASEVFSPEQLVRMGDEVRRLKRG